MKVVIVHTDFRLYWRARLEAFSNYLNLRGHQLMVVEIAGQGSPYEFSGGSYTGSKLDWHILFPEERIEQISPFRASQAVRRELESSNPDVVMAGAIAFSSGAASVSWGRRHHKSVVIFDDARVEDTPRNFLVNQFKRLIFTNVDAIFCPAPSHLPTYLGFGFLPSQVFYGVDVIDNDLYFSEVPNARSIYRAGKQDGRKFLLAVGRQVPKKNLGRFLDTFLAYRKLNPESPLNLMLIGGGPEHTTLVRKIESTGNPGVTLLPFTSSADLVRYYAMADGLVLPSLYGETWGLVVNEAMASGLPVLVSNECGCAKTLVKENDNGWTFDPLDPGDIYRVIKNFDDLDDPQRDRMGQASVEIIRGWGLERFCEGAYEALTFAVQNTRSKKGVLSGLASGLWKGRYRPN